jgi:hypothetical protein
MHHIYNNHPVDKTVLQKIYILMENKNVPYRCKYSDFFSQGESMLLVNVTVNSHNSKQEVIHSDEKTWP